MNLKKKFVIIIKIIYKNELYFYVIYELFYSKKEKYLFFCVHYTLVLVYHEKIFYIECTEGDIFMNECKKKDTIILLFMGFETHKHT